MPDAELVIAGATPPSRSDQQVGISWLGYVGDPETWRGLYAQASVFVLPSFFDASPHVPGAEIGHEQDRLGAGESRSAPHA